MVDLDVNKVKNIARELPEAFVFGTTEEGNDYWWDVVDRLKQLAEDYEREVYNNEKS